MRPVLPIALVGTLSLVPPVTDPKVTGPIPATASPGDPSHNYPFGATQADLARYAYREDEFFVEGLAHEYAGLVDTTTSTATIASGPYPYRTRVIVRRPTSAAKFNGTVIQEWNNAATGSEQENDWVWSHEHLMSAGYAYIGVTAQRRGIESPTGLKKFSPARYGSLDADAAGKFQGQVRALSFDIFSQVAQAAKRPQGVTLLADLKVRNVIATGHSHPHLYPYYNAVHPLARIIDGFVFHGSAGRPIRPDLKTPAFRLFSELEAGGPADLDLADTDYLRTWEVAGASHADWDLVQPLERLSVRDLGQSEYSPCDRPPVSRVPSRFVQYAVYDWMKVWIEKGTQPPRAPRITLTSPAAATGGQAAIARDEHGNALGGIRLAAVAVPTATNTATNSGGQYCRILGSHVPFDAETLARLYPTHAAYVKAVEQVTRENLKAGFITADGAAQIIREAVQSNVGLKSR